MVVTQCVTVIEACEQCSVLKTRKILPVVLRVNTLKIG